MSVGKIPTASLRAFLMIKKNFSREYKEWFKLAFSEPQLSTLNVRRTASGSSTEVERSSRNHKVNGSDPRRDRNNGKTSYDNLKIILNHSCLNYNKQTQ